MDAFQLETKLQQLTDELSTENFIFDFLLAYGMPKSNISRLKKKSDVNSLSTDGELLVKNKKFFFKVVADIATLKLEDLLETHKVMRIIMLTDYRKLCAYDTKTKMTLQIELDELSKNYDFFLPLAGVEKTLFYDEKEADVKASVKMAKLFDEVKKSNPTSNESEVRALNVFLTRLLFCFFAEDSNMFGASENLFTNYIDNVSKTDGSDLHKHIEILFDTLNSENRDIATNLQDFPYVNGGLFKDAYPIPTFTTRSRKLLIECGSELNWSQINPDIFGSMIQAVVTEEHRGGLGMHYTSVPNIMKVIEPLFLDELHEVYHQIVDEYEPKILELEDERKNLKSISSDEVKRVQSIKKSLGSLKSNFRKKLTTLHDRLKNIKIFDPACGSGNFLIIAYKEFRALEMKLLMAKKETAFESEIKLSNFYGIELDDFAHEVAILSLWLTEHQMNLEFSKIFGACNASLPLKGGGNIVHGNATRLEWDDVCPKEEGAEIYILGNPPYLGARIQDNVQKEDMKIVFDKKIKGFKNLDYIACWFYKGAKYIRGINAKYAFVSTNSINQGEQVSLLWEETLKEDLEIDFAHQSFKWSNNAKSNANVIVVIVGVRNISTKIKYLYKNEYRVKVKNINSYLVDGSNVFIKRRTKNISKLPKMPKGNMPYDGGNLLLSTEEKNKLLLDYPQSSKFIKRLVGAREYINNIERWCLWINDSTLKEALEVIEIKNRIDAVREVRLASSDKSANKLAERPHQFREINETTTQSIIIPLTTSERREYIPLGMVNKDIICTNASSVIYDSELWVFGLLSSKIHMVWMRVVAGRLKSDYRYSSDLCYNTFPFPKITNNQKNEIEKLVNLILDARDEEFTKTLAQLYDPDKMPDKLKEAHKNLDLYIEQCYRKKPFESDEERLAYLFKLYEKMIKEEDAK
jgi:type II restriction/modification system DNA methylase subunit YeeA